jgi:hypothetical protein
MFNKALNIYLRILNTSGFKYLIYNKLAEISLIYKKSFFVISF